MFAIQYAFQFLKKIQKFFIFVFFCGSLWVVVDRCGSFRVLVSTQIVFRTDIFRKLSLGAPESSR